VAPVLSIVMPYANAEAEINLALAMLTQIDLYQLRAYRVPALYSGQFRYRGERCEAAHVPGACERFLSALQVMAEGGWLDCDDAAPWRAAELILMGDVRARAFCRRSLVGWHCLVRHGDGTTEDPSKILGMGA
jgi:hypothetical protein